MNIAFDATAILGPMSKNRGIGNYGLDQFRNMIARDRENHYFLFNLFEPYSLGDYPNLTEAYFDCGREWSLLKAEDCALFGALVRRFIQNNKIDVFYITSPFDGHIPVYRQEWFEGVKTVATVYDIIPYVFKEHYFGPDGNVPGWYQDRIQMLRWVDELLVISQSVKDDLTSYLHFREDNIDVIWGAPGEMFRKINVTEQDWAALQKKFHLKDRFIMCTGGDDERKNIAGLIEAYGKLPRELTDRYGLAIVCKLQEASVRRYHELARKCGVGREVVLTNYVTNEELLQLYNMCSLVAFPSKYEGFGLPVTEAWACGKPTLTANNSSLCQIAGDAAVLVNADDVDDISRGLQTALRDEMLVSMTEKGQERLKLFRWPKVADRAVEAIRRLQPAPRERKELPRLAYFSPLPPQQSGIADYSVDILSVLAESFRIDVFIDDGYEVECELPESVRVLNHRDFPGRARQYSYVLYQMGNSMFHYYMYPYLKQYRGILVLHDCNMHGVARAIGLAVKKDNFQTYKEYLLEDLKETQADEILNGLTQGRRSDRNVEINGFVTNYANKIIVHSDYAREHLLRKNIGRTVAHIPLYATVLPLPDTAKAKEAMGLDPSRMVFSAFGHIHETKRALPLLKAAVRCLSEEPDCVFVFVGKLDEGIKAEFEQIRKKSGFADRIKVTGYTSLDDFCGYIDATDVCFNLRHPYNGENSGSLARILTRGKCVVVNDVGSFGELPDDCCVKLPPVDTMTEAEEIERIYQSMKQLAGDPGLRRDLGKAARAYAEQELDLRLIGRKYTEFICSPCKNVVSERMIRNLHDNEIMSKKYTEQEIRGIAATLAYCVDM